MLYDADQRHNYRRKRINWVTPRTLGVIFLFISLALMFFYAVRDENKYKTPFERVLLTPVSAFRHISIVTIDFWRNLLENFYAKQELDRLQGKMEELQRENGELMYRLRRYEAYREALNMPNEEELPTISSIIIANDKRMTKSFIINRGSKDGIRANMAVWTGKGLVGRTTSSITENAVKVQPLTDPRSAIGVYVKDTPFEGIIRGSVTGKTLLLTDSRQIGIHEENKKLMPGQKVYTSGTGMVFPRNLYVGMISDATPTAGEEGIVVNPSVDADTLQSVFVIGNSKQREDTILLLSEE